MTNPFSENFGKIPNEIVSREESLLKIYKSFTNPTPQSNMFIITGPRGCGKTVAITTIANYFKQQKNWIVIDLNPYLDLFEQLASQLYEKGKMKKLFLQKEFNFGFKGLSFSIKGIKPVSNVISLIDKMFMHLKKKTINVLITIDEVKNNPEMRAFAHSFQSFLRNNYKVFMLMTGLFKNVDAFQNQDQLTFLLRTPKINLSPLSLKGIMNSYTKIFNIDEGEAISLATFTKGYAFAFQCLGNLLCENNKTKIDNEIINKFDERMQEGVYNKIWSNLSNNEKLIFKCISKNNNITNTLIRKELNISASSLEVYKMRLRNMGLIDTTIRNKILSTLPRFENFVQLTNKLFN